MVICSCGRVAVPVWVCWVEDRWGWWQQLVCSRCWQTTRADDQVLDIHLGRMVAPDEGRRPRLPLGSARPSGGLRPEGSPEIGPHSTGAVDRGAA